MIEEFATVGCCDSPVDAGDKTGLTFEHVGNGVFYQLLGVLAVGKRHLLEPRLDIRGEMDFHAFNDTPKAPFRQIVKRDRRRYAG